MAVKMRKVIALKANDPTSWVLYDDGYEAGAATDVNPSTVYYICSNSGSMFKDYVFVFADTLAGQLLQTYVPPSGGTSNG